MINSSETDLGIPLVGAPEYVRSNLSVQDDKVVCQSV